MGAVIGSLSWDACRRCSFFATGGCCVDDQEIADCLEVDVAENSIDCGCFVEVAK